MGEFYRVCTRLNDKGKLVPANGHNFDQYKKGEAYVSAFKYTDEHVKVFNKNGSVAGISDVESDIIYFDLDNTDFEQAREDTIKVVDKLKEYGILDIAISYTSGKGFHIALHSETSFSPKEARTLAVNIAGNLPSFDSSIYNANRIIRLEGSVHPKTGLRKTRITEQELRETKLSELKELAKEQYEYVKPVKQKLSKEFMKLAESEEARSSAPLANDTVDYLSNPYKLQPWKLAISQGFFPDGNRSNALIILASTLRAKGTLKEQCYYALKASADLQSSRYGGERFSKEEIWNNIIEQVYSSSWQGGSYSEDNFPTQLQNYFEDLEIPRKEYRDVVSDIVRIGDKFDDFISYAQDIDKHTMKFGIPSLDDKLKVRKGHLIGLLAGPGIGKTSFGITLINNCSKQGANCFFGSYDMFSLNVYQKLIQRHTGYTEEEMFQFFKDQDYEKIEEFRNVLVEEYGNVAFCFKSGQTVEELKKSIEMEEEKIGDKMDLVLVDYLELVQTDKSDPTASSLEAINGLREIANEGRVVVVLLQPNKVSSKPDQPLLSYNAAKGSSMVAQAVTAMLTCHRPGYSSENPENDEYFSINCVKNRNGALFQLDFGWKGNTQTIYELDDQQRFTLNLLRDTKQDAEDDI